jgi:hypothetical protein
MAQLTSEKKFQALHESGHATVAHALGYSVSRIALDGENEAVRGYVSFRNPTEIPPAVLAKPDGPLKYQLMARTTSVAVLLAGKVAESKFGGREESKGWSADAHEITVEMAAIKDIAPAWANSEGELLSICTALSEAIRGVGNSIGRYHSRGRGFQPLSRGYSPQCAIGILIDDLNLISPATRAGPSGA